jgi:membrane protein
LSNLWLTLKDTFRDWWQDNVGQLSAALAFYTLLSLAPSLMVVLAMGEAFAGTAAARGELLRHVRLYVGPRAAEFIGLVIEGARSGDAGSLPTFAAIAVSLSAATAVFVALQNALNLIWSVQPKPGRFWRRLAYTRALSFLMVLGLGALLILSLIAGAVLSAAQEFLAGRWALSEPLIGGLNLAVSFSLMTLSIGVIYRVLPDVDISWSDVWVGAMMTSLLLIGGRSLIGLYLAHSTLRSAYGAAGSLAMVLLWVYYSAQIFLLGAEFTQAYARRYGSRIQPSRRATWSLR